MHSKAVYLAIAIRENPQQTKHNNIFFIIMTFPAFFIIRYFLLFLQRETIDYLWKYAIIIF
ncbi:MAG: hypothetical protein A3K20_01685 [Alphaproteobacteria bacterium GWA1_45_9]|nr:MAG: hypothetical protein A3K20_01685 [Alphaproteobacteria bacterium GWA1_45_9]